MKMKINRDLLEFIAKFIIAFGGDFDVKKYINDPSTRFEIIGGHELKYFINVKLGENYSLDLVVKDEGYYDQIYFGTADLSINSVEGQFFKEIAYSPMNITYSDNKFLFSTDDYDTYDFFDDILYPENELNIEMWRFKELLSHETYRKWFDCEAGYYEDTLYRKIQNESAEEVKKFTSKINQEVKSWLIQNTERREIIPYLIESRLRKPDLYL